MDDPLNPSLWSHLPSHLLSHIVSRLPVASVCRFRCVCKGLNTLPSQPFFHTLRCQACPRPPPAFLNFKAPSSAQGSPHPQELVFIDGHDPHHIKSHAISLGFLPSDYDLTLRASSGGLLLFSERHSTKGGFPTSYPISLAVCNPITRKWKRLPACPSIQEAHHLDIDVDVDDGKGSCCGYSVAVAGWTAANKTQRVIEIYRSASNRWVQLSSLSLQSHHDEHGERMMDALRALAIVGDRLFLLLGSANSPTRMEVMNVDEDSTCRVAQVVDGLGVWWIIDGMAKSQDGLVVLGRKLRGRAFHVWLWKEDQGGNPWLVLGTLENEKITSTLLAQAAYAAGVFCVSAERDQLQALHDMNERSSWRSVGMPPADDERYWAGLCLLPFAPSFYPLS